MEKNAQVSYVFSVLFPELSKVKDRARTQAVVVVAAVQEPIQVWVEVLGRELGPYSAQPASQLHLHWREEGEEDKFRPELHTMYHNSMTLTA